MNFVWGQQVTEVLACLLLELAKVELLRSPFLVLLVAYWSLSVHKSNASARGFQTAKDSYSRDRRVLDKEASSPFFELVPLVWWFKETLGPFGGVRPLNKTPQRTNTMIRSPSIC